jgi:hypothetical protein
VFAAAARGGSRYTGAALACCAGPLVLWCSHDTSQEARGAQQAEHSLGKWRPHSQQAAVAGI